MQLQRHSNKSRIALDSSQQIGSGGEGSIYAVGRDGRLAAKIYHNPTAEHERKLLAMFRNPPDDPMRAQRHASIAWPVDLLRTTGDRSQVVGFLMPRASGMFSVIDLFVPGSRLKACPLFNYQYLHRAARNIAASLASLHASGYVVGDINESNILVSTSALVTLVDTDSFQVKKPDGGLFRCGVGKGEFTPPELQARNLKDVDRLPAHDLFGLAVLIFQLLMEGTHPFAGQYSGAGDPPSVVTRIQQGAFPFGSHPGRYAPPPAAPAFGLPDPALQQLLLRCFEEGHSNPARRPGASAWQEALDRAESRLKRCRKNSQHRFGGHLASCPWCERAELLGGRDYFPSQRSIRLGSHINTAPPKQIALPALQAVGQPGAQNATPKSKQCTKPAGKKRQSGKAPAWWNDFARRSPAAHVAASALAGGVLLAALRWMLSAAVAPMRGWLTPLGSMNGNARLLMALVSLALGVGCSAGAWYAASQHR